MGKKSGPSVQAPDPYATAAAQGAANKEAAIATATINNVDTIGPYGSVKYSNTTPGSDGTPRFQQTTTLDPAQQRQLDLTNQINEGSLNTGNRLLGNIDAATQNPFQISGQAPLPTDFSADRNNIEKDLYDRTMQRLEPQFQDDTNSLENKLTNQGLTRGSEAFDKALQQNQFGINDARNSAALNAQQQAGSEQSRLFNTSLQGRQQGIQEQLTQRNQPINEVATLLGLGGNVQTPQFTAPSQQTIQPGDIQGNVYNSYNAQVNAANQKRAQGQAGINNIFGLAGSLGSSAIMSDRRMKKDIERVGTWSNGLPVYTFVYKNDPSNTVNVGFMADEVEKIHPMAVREFFGIKHVYYNEAMK